MGEARKEAEKELCRSTSSTIPSGGREVFTNPAEELPPGTNLDWDFLEPRTLLVGSPEHVAEKVHEPQEVCHLDNLILAYVHRGVPQKKTLRNLELFATKVMPLFKGSAEEKVEKVAAS